MPVDFDETKSEQGLGDRLSRDPLATKIVTDLVMTTAGFLLITIAVILTVRGLSPS
jgi:hypothetical protein